MDKIPVVGTKFCQPLGCWCVCMYTRASRAIAPGFKLVWLEAVVNSWGFEGGVSPR